MVNFVFIEELSTRVSASQSSASLEEAVRIQIPSHQLNTKGIMMVHHRVRCITRINCKGVNWWKPRTIYMAMVIGFRDFSVG